MEADPGDTPIRAAAVTGASRGIGAAVARVLADDGYSGILGARTVDEVENLASDLPGRWIGISLDVTEQRSVEAFRDQAVLEFGRLEVVVANAGISVKGRMVDFSEDDFDAVWSVNVKGVWLTLKAFAPVLVDPGGLAILTTSDVSTRAYALGGPYAASKAAARTLARTFQIEHPTLRVLELRPGATATSLGGEEAVRTRAEWALEPEVVAEAVRAAVRLPVGVRLEEVVIRSTGQKPAY